MILSNLNQLLVSTKIVVKKTYLFVINSLYYFLLTSTGSYLIASILMKKVIQFLNDTILYRPYISYKFVNG